MDGKGPYVIARILEADKVDIPAYHQQKLGYVWLCESKSVNSNFRTSMISIILRRMPSFGIRPYEYNYQKIRPMSRASVKDRCLFYP